MTHPFPEAVFSDKASDALAYAMRQGADTAEVTLTQEKGFSVTARMGDVETLEHHQEKGFVITVYRNQCCGSASTSDLSPVAIRSAIDKACNIASYSGKDEFSGLADPKRLANQYPDLELFHHWKLKPDQAIEMAVHCEEVARDQDKRITQSEGASVSTYDAFYLYANSHGFVGAYPRSFHSIGCGVVAEMDGTMQRDFEYTSARRSEDLDDVVLIAKHAAAKTLKRLGAQRLSTRRCPVIFHAPVAKGLLGNFIAAVSGSNLYRHTSFLLDHLGEKVFPEHITIHQQPHLLGGIGSAPFDSEGVKTEDRVYVREGVLESYVMGSYSARKLGMESTGNSGGVYNLAISHSDMNLEKMMQEMGEGLLITELIGQGVNLTTGDYSRGAVGFWVENGEIQYPVEEVTVAGNLKDMFLGLLLVGNDIDKRGNLRTGSLWVNEMMVAGH